MECTAPEHPAFLATLLWQHRQQRRRRIRRRAHRGEIAAALPWQPSSPVARIFPCQANPAHIHGQDAVPHPDHGQDARATSGLEPPATTGRFAPIVMRVIERIYRAEAMRYLAQGRTSVICSALQSTVYLSEKGE